ncbi:MAG: glycosyltransferase [Candidatus Sungbacteria bacterium]|nr:glycosyltransferase [Candidatus Sungbacteria bacterium]
MRVLMISADPRVKITGSESAARMADYARLFDALHIVVLSGGHIIRAWREARALRGQYDLITAQGADETGMLAYVLSRMSGVPFHLQIHTDVMSPWYRRASWKEYLRYQVARFLIPAAQCIRPVSQRISRSLGSKFQVPSSRISVLPIFTDLAPFLAVSRDSRSRSDCPAAGGNGRFRIASAGRFLDREKNFSMLIDAMPQVIGFAPEAELVLVGDGPDRENYESRIKNHGLENRVRLTGWRDDLPAIWRDCDVFVLPSWYEGWGAAVLEAMAAGLPVVMTDVGLAGEAVRDGVNGVIIPVGDQPALVRALKDLYLHPARRAALGAAGRETAARLSVSAEQYRERLAASLATCL